jgi:hypothetical protein
MAGSKFCESRVKQSDAFAGLAQSALSIRWWAGRLSAAAALPADADCAGVDYDARHPALVALVALR